MTRLQAIALAIVFCVASCIDDGLDEPDYSDAPDCSSEFSWAYCTDERVHLTPFEVSDGKAKCGLDVVYVIEGYGNVWSKTCEQVCLNACEVDQ